MAIVLTFLITLINISGYAQDDIFTLQFEAVQKVTINHAFTSDTLINPFKSIETISGLAISCDIQLNSDTSLVRIILVDEQYNEFLICESYPLLSTSMHFSIRDYAEETASLDNIHPLKIRFEIIDAAVYVREFAMSKGQITMKGALEDPLGQQRLEKIKKLNENIERKKGLWIAGETSVSKMTYNEKKQLFGGEVPNMQGFEYYVGGIFLIPGTSMQSAKSYRKSPYVDEFTWRNRHGEDWLTPVKNQASCGSCWAFAATGVTELLVNLYFNRHINADLSEQQLVSCSGTGDCSAGSPSAALDFIKSSGIIEESCFPYYAIDLACNTCANPSQTVRIGIKGIVNTPSNESIKKSIIKGPVTLGIAPWHHVVTLAGYKTLKANDRIYIKSSTQDTWVTIPASDPLVGQTAWLIKNSWGPSFGENGYAYVVTDLVDLNHIYEANGPVYSIAYNDQDVLCTDTDGDGYYTWGIGSKPAHCPPCPDQPDGDDSDPCLGPMNEFGIITGITPSPIATDVIITDIAPVPDLTVQGNNVRWYKDEGLDTLVCEGNIFSTGLSSIGIYKYFVTQTLSDCESVPSTVNLSILPLPPVANNLTACTGQEDIMITAVGQNIRWYSDSENPLYDIRDRQTYNVVTIGDQIWMRENLNYYTPSGSWYYNNDSLYFARPYGRFYDWHTAQEVCPADWHLPSRNEWMELRDYLGGEYVAGGKMKDSGFVHWDQPNTGANNESGFTALAGGLWETTPTSAYAEFLGRYAAFLSSESNPEVWWLSYNDSELKLKYFYYDYGFSVRCVRYLSQAVASGNTLNIDYRNPGIYRFYVTQTINGIESQADTVFLTIIQNPEAPISENIMLCEGEEVPDLAATGDNIQWYTDSELTNLVGSGDTFATGQTIAGTHTYYATQTVLGCESMAESADLVIYPIPGIDLGMDSTIYPDQSLMLGPFANDKSYVWSDGSQIPYFLVSGSNLGPGSYQISVIATDSNGCIGKDSVEINVLPYTSINLTDISRQINIFPNPAEEFIQIGLTNFQYEDIIIKIYNQKGEEINLVNTGSYNQDELLTLDLSYLPSGVYYIQILSRSGKYAGKIIMF